MLNATQKNIKNINTREVTFLQHKQKFDQKIHIVQYVKKINFKRLLTFNIAF